MCVCVCAGVYENTYIYVVCVCVCAQDLSGCIHTCSQVNVPFVCGVILDAYVLFKMIILPTKSRLFLCQRMRGND